jgi:hypothetical protein
MKITTIAFVALGLCATITAYAGDKPKITWGDEFELPKKHYEVGFIGNAQTGYVEVSHRHGESIGLQKFSSSLKLTGESEIPTDGLPKGYMIESLTDINKKNYILYSTWSKDDKVERFVAQELDVNKGSFNGAPKELLKSDVKLSGSLVMTGLYQFNTVGKWNTVQSIDSSKVLVYYRVKPEEKRDAFNKDKIGLFVFDNKLNKIWGQEVEMPYTEKMMDNDDYVVDKNGTVYILAKVREDGSNKDSKDGKPNYHYEVLTYTNGAKKPSISSFAFADKYVSDIALIEDPNGRVICAGYYSKEKRGSVDGAFFLSYDEGSKSMKNIKKGFYEFPSDVMKQFESARTQRKMEKKEEKGKDAEVSNLKFRYLSVGNDGSITLFGEQYAEVTTTYYNGRTSTTTTHYYYDDIYVIQIGANGEQNWVKKIPKRQVGLNRAADLGIHVHSAPSGFYVFFVDNIKNLNISPDVAPELHASGAGGVLMSVKISNDGGTTKTNIFDFREEKMSLLVKDFSDVSPTQVIGRARKLKGAFQMNFSEGKPLMITMD